MQLDAVSRLADRQSVGWIKTMKKGASAFLDPGAGNVVFNFRQNPIGDLGAFATGYHRSGQALAQKFAGANGFPDYDGYPILFLYRHALELYLKAVVYKGAQLLDLLDGSAPSTEGIFGQHGLKRLKPALRQVLRGMGWLLPEDDPGTISLDQLEALIDQVEELDPGSYTFRYPITRTGGAGHGTHKIVNVLAFADKLDRVLTILDGALSGLSEKWDNTAELAYELQELERDASQHVQRPGADAPAAEPPSH